ncbi:MAG: transporter permease [Paenibacillaceae bacterium]|jgi:putative aldouronate transport system permease protein|nr:transporter permease [Paenibacillaceae bacterium]
MIQSKTWGSRLFTICNYIFLFTLAILCVLPIIHILAVSLSANSAVLGNKVTFWPVQFTMKSYQYALENPLFVGSILNSVKRVVLGVGISLFLVIITAYPLSKESSRFKARTFYAWIMIFTTLFGGGLIPTYLIVKGTGLIDTVWALIIPDAVAVFNVVLLLNFFRGLPKELEEAAIMDGANHWRILWGIFVPLALPSLATIFLFALVGQWNSWFDGILYLRRPEDYPLTSYLQTVIIKPDNSLINETDLLLLQYVNEQTLRAAQIFLGALPILVIYPFLQRYFVKGIVLGSVKG